MNRGQKVITVALWAVLGVAMVGVVVGKWMAPGAGPPVLYPAADFALVDQDNKPVSPKDLRGRPYVAAFIFTMCGDVCPRMTRTMADLQPKLPAAVRLVSFSVDPEHDTPAVLKEYAKTYKADESRWRFLTGTPQQITDVALGMKLPTQVAGGNVPVVHSEKLLLIDGEGNVRGFYFSADPEAMKKLLTDAEAVARETKRPPGGGAS